MNSEDARELFERYRASVTYVEVENVDGDRHIG